jgi:hypothetical protein
MYPVPRRNLDYRQLHAFWTVAKEGSVTCDSANLFLAQPTVSGQLRPLCSRYAIFPYGSTFSQLREHLIAESGFFLDSPPSRHAHCRARYA